MALKITKPRSLQLFCCVLFGLFLALSACEIETSLQQPEDGGQETGLQPKLSAIETEVFAMRCATSNCHTSAAKTANLDLSPGNAYASLVGVRAILSTEGLNRVKPGSSEQSFIIEVLDGSNPTQMPLNSAPLDQATIDVIAEWIDAGAMDN